MESIYTEHVQNSFAAAEAGISKISGEVAAIPGMSGLKTRHFYNNLGSMPDARYLEIGTWQGSTICSAMFGNKATVVCIDNWSEFGGPKDVFLENFYKFRGESNASFIEHDCFTLKASILPKFNIYLYDGNHTEESHYKALLHYYDNLDDVFIFIVDDWNWEDVRKGTRDSFSKLGLTVVYEHEIRMTQDNSHTSHPLANQTWWNGIYCAVLSKKQPK